MPHFCIVVNNPLTRKRSFYFNQFTGEITMFTSKSKARKVAQYLNLMYFGYKKYSVKKIR